MENMVNREYSKITNMYFAIWQGDESANYILIDFANARMERGSQPVANDIIAARRREDDDNAFVELISYDRDGRPILNFDDPADDEPEDMGVPVPKSAIEQLRLQLQAVDILSWRNNLPSSRKGISWRIDIYSEGGEKHMSGQARFPTEWTRFSKAVSALVESCEG